MKGDDMGKEITPVSTWEMEQLEKKVAELELRLNVLDLTIYKLIQKLNKIESFARL